jgi:hypothetical protein
MSEEPREETVHVERATGRDRGVAAGEPVEDGCLHHCWCVHRRSRPCHLHHPVPLPVSPPVPLLLIRGAGRMAASMSLSLGWLAFSFLCSLSHFPPSLFPFVFPPDFSLPHSPAGGQRIAAVSVITLFDSEAFAVRLVAGFHFMNSTQMNGRGFSKNCYKKESRPFISTIKGDDGIPVLKNS